MQKSRGNDSRNCNYKEIIFKKKTVDVRAKNFLSKKATATEIMTTWLQKQRDLEMLLEIQRSKYL